MKVKKISMYMFFPILSVLCLIFMKSIRDSFIPPAVYRFREFLYYNILISAGFFFIIGYLIPTFLSIWTSKKVKYLLIASTLLFVILFISIHLYLLATVPKLDIFPDTVDMLIGILGGTLLGISCACHSEKTQ